MKNRTEPERLNLLDRWTSAARGTVEARRLGKPKGELNQIIRMSAEWSKIPNTLYEDEAGHLWLAFTKDGAIEEDGSFEVVSVEMALDWLQHVSEFVDGWDGDVADVCRISLAELARRPSDLERAQKAYAEELKYRAKSRPAHAGRKA